MNEDLEQLLAEPAPQKRVAARFDEMLAAADKQRLAVPDAARAPAARRVAAPAGERARLAHQAGDDLPEQWTLESFPFKMQPGVNQRQIRTFAELDFIPKAENIVFIGETGVGKTGLACGLLLKALQNGYRGVFINAQDLFDEMYASLADRSTRKLLNHLARIDVLADRRDGLPQPQARADQHLLQAHGGALSPPPDDHHHQPRLRRVARLPRQPAAVDALLSRLRDQCHTVKIDGPCLRAQQG